MSNQKKWKWQEYTIKQEESIGYAGEESEYGDGGANLMSGLMSPTDIPREFNAPFKHYNWHKCCTNFNVSKGLVKKLSEIAGVEIILPLSRYTFIMAVGIMFSEIDVKGQINEELAKND